MQCLRPRVQSRTQTSSKHLLFSVVVGVRHQIILDWTFLADPREVKFFSYPVRSPDRELALLWERAKWYILTCFISFCLIWPHFVGVMLNTVYGHRRDTNTKVTKCKHVYPKTNCRQLTSWCNSYLIILNQNSTHAFSVAHRVIGLI